MKNNLKRSLSLVIPLILVFSLIFWIYAETEGYMGIQRTINEIKANSTDQETLVRNLLKWEIENLNFSYAPLTGSKDLDRFLKVWIYSNRPNLIFYHKLGACGEYSTLFMEMAKTAGIQTRIVTTQGEDHQWNEVLISDRWVHVDSTLSPPSNFDNPYAYGKNGWGWNLSKVYAYHNGEQIDVTNTYIEKSGVLNVTVNENNMPLKNVEVIIGSQFRMEKDPDFYKIPLETTRCTTSSNGTCTFYLGENNYTIFVIKGDLPFKYSPYLLEFEKKNVTLTANATIKEVLSFPATKIESAKVVVYVTIVYLFGIIYLAMMKSNFRISKLLKKR